MLRSVFKYYLLASLIWTSCSDNNDASIDHGDKQITLEYAELPQRVGEVPETTNSVPHQQIDVEPVAELHEELIRRVYSMPGVEEKPSVVSPWQGISLVNNVSIHVPDAIIGDREFAHIHHDGSLHIFIEPFRALEAVNAGWAVLHPFAVQRLDGYEGFVMLYTPQTSDELDVIFQLIVDGYNYVTDQRLIASDYYD